MYYPKSTRCIQAGANEDAARDSLSSPSGESTPTTCDKRWRRGASRPVRLVRSELRPFRLCGAVRSQARLRSVNAPPACACVFMYVCAYARVSLPLARLSPPPYLAQVQIYRCLSRATHQASFALPDRELRRRSAPQKKSVFLARRRRRRRRCERFTLPSARCDWPSLKRSSHGRTKFVARGRPPRPFSLLFPALSRSAPFVDRPRSTDDGVFPRQACGIRFNSQRTFRDLPLPLSLSFFPCSDRSSSRPFANPFSTKTNYFE